MFFTLSDNSNIICYLTSEQLQFIPKIILLREFGNRLDYLWNKLPEHIKQDPEVQSYRRCLEHYNQPSQQLHIDGLPPLIKNCYKCKLQQQQQQQQQH